MHCDLNNFYASVEVKNHPEYKDKPVAVAGDPNKRTGIILAKNQLAKEQGVTTGEVIWMAKQHCPDLICLAPHHEEYAKISKECNKNPALINELPVRQNCSVLVRAVPSPEYHFSALSPQKRKR